MNEFDKRILRDDGLFFWLCQIAGQLDSAVVIINPKKSFTIEYANSKFMYMTGYSETDMIGSTLSLLQGQHTDLLNEKNLQESIENGVTFKTSSFLYRKDGTSFWSEVSHLAIRNRQEELQYCVLTMRDVTDAINVESLIELEREVYFSLEKGGTFESVAENICHTVASTFWKECHCSIVLVDDNKRTLKAYGELCKDLKNIDEHALLMGIRPGDEGRLHKTVIIEDLSQSEYYESYRELVEKFRLVSLWGQPILNMDGKVIGVFTMYFKQHVEPKDIDLKFLNRIAPIATLAVKYFDQKKAIRRLAYQDVASGLNNFERF